MNSNDIEILADQVGVPIRKLSAETMGKVNDAPQGQKRTSNYKKAVKIVEDLVFKGPFECDEKMLIKNLSYTYAIDLMEEALLLLEWQRGSLRWQYVGCWNDDQYYLVGPNVGKRNNIASELMTTKIEKNVPVVPRKSHVMRVSDIEGTEQLTDHIKSATLQHLYLRFLLDIGDTGTYNVLIREDHANNGRLIAGVDLEEEITDKVKLRRSRVINQRLELLFSKGPYPKHYALYQSDVRKIKPLSFSQLGQQTLNNLRAVGIDLKRLKKNIQLW